jgi:hypothetical protein
MQSILSVQSRFDPFASKDDAKASLVVIGQLCKVLNSLVLYLPEFINSVKFDFIKLLPTDAKAFCSTSFVLQYQLLCTLKCALELQKVRVICPSRG